MGWLRREAIGAGFLGRTRAESPSPSVDDGLGHSARVVCVEPTVNAPGSGGADEGMDPPASPPGQVPSPFLYVANADEARALATRVCPAARALGLRTLILPLELDDSFRVDCF